MRLAYTVAEVREAEQRLMATLPEGALMQRAAAGLASVCAALLGRVYGAKVVVLAGSGDNGGDALYAGARLARRGAVVVAVAAAERAHPAASAALRQAGGRLVGASGGGDRSVGGDRSGRDVGGDRSGRDVGGVLARADLVIDGLLGIGGRGGLREPALGLAQLTEEARQSGTLVVAVDLPSGVDADTGVVSGHAIRADVTVTFGTYKPGLLIDPGAGYAGVTEMIDIGLRPYLGSAAVAAPQSADIARMLPRPGAESDKYRRGVLGVLAGSERFTGAAVLSVGGAIKGGAGMVRLVSAPAAVGAVRQRWPEALLTVADPSRPWQTIEAAGRVQAWVAGPGMGTDVGVAGLLSAVLRTDLPVLIDADAITIVSARRELLRRPAPTLITPHTGELGRLLNADPRQIESRRLEFAKRAASEHGIVVLLKGSTTVVAAADEDRPARVNPTGTGWLATAGSGDVLSGLAGAMLAQGLSAEDAATAAAYLHGLAARIAAGDGGPIGSSDLFAALPTAFAATARAVC